jgi:hypothetical protein
MGWSSGQLLDATQGLFDSGALGAVTLADQGDWIDIANQFVRVRIGRADGRTSEKERK